MLGRLLITTAIGAGALVATHGDPSRKAMTAMPPRESPGLCRRAPALAALPPEAGPTQQPRRRGAGRYAESMPVDAPPLVAVMTPPPPPPPAPIPGSAADVVMAAPPMVSPPSEIDLLLMVDTTGSMGDEIGFLKSEMRGVLASLKRAHPGLDLRVALLFYRDVGDDYVTRSLAFTTDLDAAQADLRQQSADGGGDYP